MIYGNVTNSNTSATGECRKTTLPLTSTSVTALVAGYWRAKLRHNTMRNSDANAYGQSIRDPDSYCYANSYSYGDSYSYSYCYANATATATLRLLPRLDLRLRRG